MKSVLLVMFLSLGSFAQAEVSCVLTTITEKNAANAVTTPLEVFRETETNLHLVVKKGNILARFYGIKNDQFNESTLSLSIGDMSISTPAMFKKDGSAELTVTKGFDKPDGTFTTLECHKN